MEPSYASSDYVTRLEDLCIPPLLRALKQRRIMKTQEVVKQLGFTLKGCKLLLLLQKVAIRDTHGNTWTLTGYMRTLVMDRMTDEELMRKGERSGRDFRGNTEDSPVCGS